MFGRVSALLPTTKKGAKMRLGTTLVPMVRNYGKNPIPYGDFSAVRGAGEIENAFASIIDEGQGG